MVSSQAATAPGMCALLGSGETTGVGRRVMSTLLRQVIEPREIAVLDTPAGFQPNRRQVAERIVEFLTENLAQFHPRSRIVETRRVVEGAVPDAAALATLARACCIVAGPGSPTYMIRELAASAYLDIMRQAHAKGTMLYISSAASVALGAYSIPVYEIFKVGEDPHWRSGLDFLSPFGMSLAIVPHWNNSEGGATVDTRFCYMGQDRFTQLRQQLPPEVTILGIDEHTACLLDFATLRASVEGKGRVHLIRDEQLFEWSAGETFSMELLGAHASSPDQQQVIAQYVSHPIEDLLLTPGLDPRIEEDNWANHLPPQLIDAVLAVRTDLRNARHWKWSDQLRDALIASGIVIEDTPTGSKWHVADE